jgi:membrane protein implicated in regulation of membrane protease activity
MLKRLNGFFVDLSAHVSLVVLIVGSSTFAVAWGWAASVTHGIAKFGPIGWVAAASLGAALFILLALGFAKSRQQIVRTSIERRFFQDPDRINPLEDHFRRKRIRLADLVSPIDPFVRGKTFDDCEIIGPANVVLRATRPASGGMLDCRFSQSGAMIIRDDAPPLNSLILEDCMLRGCRVHQVTLLIPESAYQHLNEQMPGMPLLSPAPSEASSSQRA